LFDIIVIVFLLAAMFAGYLSGGFREILRIVCMILAIILFSVPSVKEALLSFAGRNLFHVAYIIGFIVIYFILQMILKLALHSIIEDREGTLGGINKSLGIGAGLFKGGLIIFFAVYVMNYLWTKKILVEFKPSLDGSYVYRFCSEVIKLFS
jgi:uncharacterized membrane protein required for colicin V production